MSINNLIAQIRRRYPRASWIADLIGMGLAGYLAVSPFVAGQPWGYGVLGFALLGLHAWNQRK